MLECIPSELRDLLFLDLPGCPRTSSLVTSVWLSSPGYTHCLSGISNCSWLVPVARILHPEHWEIIQFNSWPYCHLLLSVVLHVLLRCAGKRLIPFRLLHFPLCALRYSAVVSSFKRENPAQNCQIIYSQSLSETWNSTLAIGANSVLIPL